ncbi:MAG: hypothetical protein E6K10_07950 [Methanobacteriota archaeon]|nr:MAG: hypothetical protein E6K10_07950 [Euryarchaeota archaeon]
MPFTAIDIGTFITILLLTFSIFLVITGAFTAYFGSGKSRKIGGGLLGGGLVIGIVWAFLVSSYGPLNGLTDLKETVIQTIVVLIAAVIGAAAAVGLFLLAIMKS